MAGFNFDMKCYKCGKDLSPTHKDLIVRLDRYIHRHVKCSCGEINVVEYASPAVTHSFKEDE